MDDQITINMSDLDALIERKLAEKQAAAVAPKRGATPGCNCEFEGFLDRAMHKFGCPWADPKGNLAKQKVQELFG